MADDNILRSYRSTDLARRVNAPAAPRGAQRDIQRDAPRDAGGNDPLAELARLIGQSDPFADFDRNGGQASEPRPRADSAPSDWRKTAAALARESMRNPPVADPHYDEVDSAIAAAKSLAPSDDPFARLASHVSQQALDHAAPDRAAFDHAAYDQAAVPQAGYVDAPYDEPRVASHADGQFDDSRHAEAPPDAHESESYFFDGAPAPTDERFYDDPPRRRATNGIVTAIVLIGCGILGTAGAYGYRTYYSGARPTDAPIISAEKSPNKMVPAAGGGDSQSGKSVERIGAANERVVARQEEPVTLSDPNGPRVVLPAPFTTTPGPGPLAQPNAALPGGVPTEPKKVRTVAIRPDGAADPMMVRPVGGAGSLPPQTAPANAATRQPPATKPAPPPAHNGGGPLSLEPQGQIGDSASSYQAAPQHPAPAPASAPRLASVSPPAAAGGGYVVQISSQRSEADAQASFRSLQSKFPSQLGDREAIVRRADLGPKGVYYRAMVGPFGSAGDADQFCGGLKAAGGQCIVQKN